MENVFHKIVHKITYNVGTLLNKIFDNGRCFGGKRRY